MTDVCSRILLARVRAHLNDTFLVSVLLLEWIALAAMPCVLWMLVLGPPESSSGTSSDVPIFGLLWMACAMLLAPRAIDLLRQIRSSPVPAEHGARTDPPWLSPVRQEWLRETRWLLTCMQRPRDKEVMVRVWEYVARTRSLDYEARRELRRADVDRSLSSLAELVIRNSDTSGGSARARLLDQAEVILGTIESLLLVPSVTEDPYR